jgi:beta-galactosidase
VPTAGNEITFEISGPGRIIGVGNGDPSSHEPDQYVETVSGIEVSHWRSKAVDGMTNRPEVASDYDDSTWQPAFTGRDAARRGAPSQESQNNVYRGSFELAPVPRNRTVILALRNVGVEQAIYLNGSPVTQEITETGAQEFKLNSDLLHSGKNVIAIVAAPASSARGNRGGQSNPAMIRVVVPAKDWQRSLFNGLAQVIVQSTGKPGDIQLTAKSTGLADAVLRIHAEETALRPAIR